MLFLIFIIVVFLGFIIKDSKFINTVIVLFIWIIMGFNYSNADYLNYQYSYLLIGSNYYSSNMEIGYQFLMKISNYLDLTYQQFVMVISMVGLLLITSTIKKYSNHPNTVLALYMIFPLLLDTVQLRGFLSMSIVVFAIRYLEVENKINIFKYLSLIAIAFSIHFSAFFYFLFIIIFFIDEKKILAISASVTLFFVVFQSKIFQIASIVIPIARLKRYSFGMNISYTTFFIYILYILFNIFIVFKVRKEYEKQYLKFHDDKIILKRRSFLTIVLKLNYISLLILPFIMTALEYFRIHRNILILNYIALFTLFNKNKIKVRNLPLYLSYVAFVFLALYIFIYIQFYDTVIFPIFNYNILVDKLLF
ncbi:TPA: EpsG family protein [Streptococcus suis]